MRVKLFLASILLFMLLITFQGCGRGSDTQKHCTSLGIDNAPPASSFVLEKVTRDSGLIIYKRQETTADSVFYLEVVTYWVNENLFSLEKRKRIDTLQQWRAAHVTEEENKAQEESIRWRIQRIREVFGDLYSL